MQLRLKSYLNFNLIRIFICSFNFSKLGLTSLSFKLFVETLQLLLLLLLFVIRILIKIDNGPDQEDFFKNTNRFFQNYLGYQFFLIQLSVVTTQTLICSSNPNEIGFSGSVYAHIPLLNCTFLIFK